MSTRLADIAIPFLRTYTICMNTATDLPGFLREPTVMHGTQRDLFGDVDTPTASTYALYAEVVFDRPLDHAYTYAVPESLQSAVAVGA